jgi:hypothetical protein
VRAQATPAAYESSHAKQFSHIHFLAHGTASRLSPLDSAIVLSKDADNSESLKLYTRKINPFHCMLACHDFRLLQHRRAFLSWRRTSRFGTGVSPGRRPGCDCHFMGDNRSLHTATHGQFL